MNNLTTGKSVEEFMPRICMICHEPVRELRKASYLQAAAGLRIVVHDRCLESIANAVRDEERKQAGRVLQDALNTIDKVASTMNKQG